MEKICIEMLGCKVNYVSDLPLLKFLKEKIAYTEFNHAIVHDEYDETCHYNIYYKNDLKKNVESSKKNVFISYPIEELDEECILYAGMPFFERQFAEKSMFTCHSACIVKNGKGVLFLGDAGAGKTSLALRMCLNHNYKLLSNDQTVIGLEKGNLFAFKGTQFINFRKVSVDKNLPEFSYLFDNRSVDAWASKITVLAEDVGIQTTNEKALLKNIYFVKCLDIESFKNKSAVTFGNQFKLYQNLSMHIRGVAASIHDKNGFQIGYNRSLETKITDKNKNEVIKKINELEHFSLLTGSINDIIKHIEKEM